MIRTQIQLPDEVYARAKRLCEAREISLAELARRGIEYILGVYTADGSAEPWRPPSPRRLGWRGLNETELKEHAQSTAGELSVARRRPR